MKYSIGTLLFVKEIVGINLFVECYFFSDHWTLISLPSNLDLWSSLIALSPSSFVANSRKPNPFGFLLFPIGMNTAVGLIAAFSQSWLNIFSSVENDRFPTNNWSFGFLNVEFTTKKKKKSQSRDYDNFSRSILATSLISPVANLIVVMTWKGSFSVR